MSKAKISLCMIVKDEADQLPRCLRSVKNAVDEIIIVDTGSTDHTVAIARSFGAKVLSIPWTGDFAHARNQSIARAKGKWILFLDADEELDYKDRMELRLCADHLEIDGFFLQIQNHNGNDIQSPVSTINPILRMFRNHPLHRFRGKVHEQIAYSILERKPNARFHISTIKIHHYGYDNQIVMKKEKTLRNVTLLKELLSKEPLDPFHHYNMAVEYMRMNDCSPALEHIRKALELIAPGSNYIHLLHKYEARCLLALGRLEEALEACKLGVKAFPDYTDLYHLKGVVHCSGGQIEAAKEAFLQAIKQGAAPGHYHTESGIGTFLTCYGLGQLYENSGDSANAIHWYAETIKHNPRMIQPLQKIIRMFKAAGEEAELTRYLKNHFQLTSSTLFGKLLQLLNDDGCYETAIHLLDEFGEQHSRYGRPEEMFKYWLWSGRVDEAELVTGKEKWVDEEERQNARLWLQWLISETGNPPLSQPFFGKRSEELESKSVFRINLFEFGVKAAYFNHYKPKALRLLTHWESENPDDRETIQYDAYRKSKTFIALADSLLSSSKPSSPEYTLSRKVRQILPLAYLDSGGH